MRETLSLVEGAAAARDAWGANCGPVALAAATGVGTGEARGAVCDAEGRFRGWMGVRDLRRAVGRCGHRVERAWTKPIEPVDVLGVGLQLQAFAATQGLGPAPVLVMVRFCGPWDGRPRAAACYRHVVTYRHCLARGYAHEQRVRGPGWVLDANQLLEGSAYWYPAHIWSRRTLLKLIPERGDGRVAVDWLGEVGLRREPEAVVSGVAEG